MLRTRGAKSETPLVTQRGRVGHLFFSGPSFSAGVLETDAQKSLRFAGKIMVEIGDEVVLRGNWEPSKYGPQLKVASFEYALPLDAAGLAGYIARNPKIKGIGPAKAKALAETYGDAFETALAEEPEELAKAARVPLTVIETLRDEWTRTRSFNLANTWLASFELTHHQISTLVRKYGNSVIAVFKADPYQLIREVQGYGFKRVDKIARKMGTPKDHTSRIKAGLVACMQEALDDGHCWCAYEDLIEQANLLLVMDTLDSRERIAAAIDALASEKELALDHADGRFLVSLPHIRRMEFDLAEVFKGGSKPNPHFQGEALTPSNLPVELNDGQRQAVLTSLAHSIVVITGGAGAGKAQPLDARLLTPHGWVRMGEIKPGDAIIGSNGRPCKVTEVFPQGVRDVFKVTMTDGASTECCEEHLWQTMSQKDRERDRPGSAKPLKEIGRSLFTSNKKRNHWIPMVQPVEFSCSSLPLDPYLLGLLLGDGSFRVRYGCGFSNPDAALVETLRLLLPKDCRLMQSKSHSIDYRICGDGTRGSNAVYLALHDLELSGLLSSEKFIPDKYKLSASAYRLALLQGLMDTDGSAGGHSPEYSTSSKQLAEDVRFLVQSLGGTCSMKEREPAYTYLGERKMGKTSYRLHICLPGYIQPFRLPRKAAQYSPRTKYLPRRAIEKVEFIGRKPVQCIAVNSPDQLYVTDDFIVTHNTYTIRTLCDLYERAGKSVQLCAPTGKAAKRMEEATGRPAMTIHRLLEYNGREFQVEGPIGTDLLVTDESSMIDVPLFWHLLRAVDLSKTAVVLVGDHNQLPPVGPGNVLRDLLATKAVPYVVLGQVVRQAGILKENCAAVLKGAVAPSSPVQPDGLRAWYRFTELSDGDDLLGFIRALYQTKLSDDLHLDLIHDVQLLSPTRKGSLGVGALNIELQRLIQKKLYGVEVPLEKGLGRAKPLLHDKVIQRRNNYSLGIMNGAVGQVVGVDRKTGDLSVRFDGREVTLKKSEGHLGDIDLAYCLTIHQVQGSEFPVAIVICHKSHAFQHHRNLLYTGVTRAKRAAVILGDAWGVRNCAAKVETSKRRTWLALIGGRA